MRTIPFPAATVGLSNMNTTLTAPSISPIRIHAARCAGNPPEATTHPVHDLLPRGSPSKVVQPAPTSPGPELTPSNKARNPIARQRAAVARLLLGAILVGTTPSVRAQPLPTQPTTATATALAHLDPFAAFERWVEQFLVEYPPAADSALWLVGESLAADRRDALAVLIRDDPERALALAVPPEIRQQFPSRILRHLEEPVSGVGRFRVLASIPSALEKSFPAPPTIRRSVTLGDREYRAHVYGRRTGLGSRPALVVHGIALDDDLALDESPVRVLSPAEPSPALPSIRLESFPCPPPGSTTSSPWRVHLGDRVVLVCDPAGLAQIRQDMERQELQIRSDLDLQELSIASEPSGTRRFLFLRLAYPNAPAGSITHDSAVQLMAQVNSFLIENSSGNFDLAVTVTPLLPMPRDEASYGSIADLTSRLNKLRQDALDAALAAGFPATDYDLDAIHGSSSLMEGCHARVDERGIWISGDRASLVAHEIGHNLGLWHANAWKTLDRSVTGPGITWEYWNPYDTMGFSGTGHFNAAFKHRLGWLPATSVQTITSNGVFRLHPIDAPQLSPERIHALRLPKDEREYWIEARRAHDAAGIHLNWAPWRMSIGGTHLLDVTPGSEGGFFDAPLIPGRHFYEPDLGLRMVHLPPDPASPATADLLVQRVYFVPVEAESDPSLEATRIRPDQTASQGRLVALPVADEGSIPLTIEAPTDDDYTLWCRVRSPAPGTVPLILAVDHGTLISATAWSAGPTEWTWSPLQSVPPPPASTPGTHRFPLARGLHRFSVQSLAPDIDLDAVLLTNDPTPDIPLVVAPIPQQTTIEGGGLIQVPFTVVTIAPPGVRDAIVATSSDQDLVCDGDLVISGDHPNHILTMSPQPGRLGTTTITLRTVKANGTASVTRFDWTIIGRVQSLTEAAAPGAIIRIAPGIYTEHLILSRDVILEGSGPSQTILDGGAIHTVLTVATNTRVVVRNLSFRNGSIGVRNHGHIDLDGCSIRGTRGYFGAIWNTPTGSATVRNSTLSSNVCFGFGGGVFNQGSITLVNCTISGNRVVSALNQNRKGGGLYNTGEATLLHCTLSQNRATSGGGLANRGTATIGNCIIGANRSDEGISPDLDGTIVSDGFNLIQNTRGAYLTGDQTGNLTGVDPRLGPLRENGGPCATHALLADSPAIDAGLAAATPLDQTGRRRPFDVDGVFNAADAGDIGAVEFVPGPDPIIHLVLFPGIPPQPFLTSGGGLSWVVQASSNLAHWETIALLTNVVGRVSIADPAIPASTVRFYRALVPPTP